MILRMVLEGGTGTKIIQTVYSSGKVVLGVVPVLVDMYYLQGWNIQKMHCVQLVLSRPNAVQNRRSTYPGESPPPPASKSGGSHPGAGLPSFSRPDTPSSGKTLLLPLESFLLNKLRVKCGAPILNA